MADLYLLERTALDITDTVGLPAPSSGTATKEYDPNGQAAGVSYLTPGTVTSSGTSEAVARELFALEIVAPLNNAGQFEDLREVYPVIDDTDLRKYINIPGNGNLLMTPFRKGIRPRYRLNPQNGKVEAYSFIPFGVPLWLAAAARVPNMPVVACCPKFLRTLAMAATSRYGVTGAGSNGFRMRAIIFQYTNRHLAEISKVWDNTVNLQTQARIAQGKDPLQFTYTGPSTIDRDTFSQLPGGLDQQGQKIMPLWLFAFNNAATESQAAFALTNLTDLEGGTGHVENTYQDLGLAYATKNAAYITHFGVKGVDNPPGQTQTGTAGQNLSRAGFIIDGDTVPNQVGGLNGFDLTTDLDDLTWGATESNIAEFRAVPAVPGEPLLIYRDTYAPFIAANGSPIPQDVAAVCEIGYSIEGV
jgi:hypothetical protein